MANFLFVSNTATSQFGDAGFTWSVGAGFGYSSHADSYQVDEFYKVKEFSGVRIFIFETKVGWTFGEKTMLYLDGTASPGNSTITPYRSYSYGVGIGQSFGFTNSIYVKGGVGKKSAGVGPDDPVGSGILANLGAGWNFGKNLFLEANVLFGSMQSNGSLDPDPFIDNDFQINVMVSYAIF